MPSACVKITDDCICCEACFDVCPSEALSYKDGRIVVDDEKCIPCYACLGTCPQDAIVEA